MGSISRRDFIRTISLAGGGSLAYFALKGMGLLGEARNTLPILEGRVSDQKVLILGGGLAGLSAAYELEAAGYECEILEAQERAGGRCWTIRDGSQFEEIDGRQKKAGLDAALYFNPGPARIPQHHFSTMHYCKQFALELEQFANQNAAALLHYEGEGALSGQAIARREAVRDMSGYSSELLAKAIDQGALDEELNEADGERLLDYLNEVGGLDMLGKYQGSERRGYLEWPGAHRQKGEIKAHHSLESLLDAKYWNLLSFDEDIHQQMSMFQIRGGMDQLAISFEDALRGQIRFGAQVFSIQNTEDGVSVEYSLEGEKFMTRADFCICTIPLSVLANIESNFSPKKKSAIRRVQYVPAAKMGLQFGRRFWEEDEAIYGGISRTNLAINQIWYPSTGFLGEKGLVIGYYNFGQEALALGQMSDAQRLELALEQGEKIHAQYRDNYEAHVSVSWDQMPFARGAFAYYSEDERGSSYEDLIEAEGRVYLAGEHMSYLNGWMAGAFESAWASIEAIHSRVQS